MSKAPARGKKKKEKESRRVIDKFSLKTWYTIHAPDIFGGEEIAETPSAEPEYVIGRTINRTIMDLNGDYKKMHVKLTFKIDKTKGDHAYSQFHGHEYTRDYLRSMIRRRRTRIDGIFNINTLDGAKLRTSVIALTPFRCKTSHEKAIRKIMEDTVIKRAAKIPFAKLVNEIVSGRLATEIYKRSKKIHPIQNVDIWKSRVVNLPTIILEEEVKPAAPKPEEPKAEEPKVEEPKPEKEEAKPEEAPAKPAEA
ncbi:MAG: 30S ribosomal protein S3ae [Candidatus Heimdallarchaeota archaeon]